MLLKFLNVNIFAEISPAGAEILCADGRREGRPWRSQHMLSVTLRKALQNVTYWIYKRRNIDEAIWEGNDKEDVAVTG